MMILVRCRLFHHEYVDYDKVLATYKVSTYNPQENVVGCWIGISWAHEDPVA